MMAAIVILLLILLLAVETPIAFAVGVAAFLGLMLTGLSNAPIAAQRMFSGMNSYGLLALPLFILAGNSLVAGGVIGYTAGPKIACKIGAKRCYRRSHYRRYRR